LRTLLRGLRQDRFFLTLLAALLRFSLAVPSRIATYGSLLDWPTIVALTGLLVLMRRVCRTAAPCGLAAAG
jgi:hypothetical protein